MLDKIKGFHIEPTNMCTLKCPRCPRTNFVEQFKPKNWDNQNLNLDHLKQFLDIDLTGMSIGLNGNYGDPIYYPNLFELIAYFKNKKCKISIHTNGSYKSKVWWQELAKLLDQNDIVNFSIDGTPGNFTTYRINADWTSIQTGIEVMVSSRAQVVWKYIVFSYNEDTVDEARIISQKLGMDDFVLNNSDRWEDNDWLKPIKYAKIENAKDGLLYNSSHVGGRDSTIILWKQHKIPDKINPVCKSTNNMHFISADGIYMPCCWAGDYRFYYKNEFYKNRETYDISKTTISQMLATKSTLDQYYNNIEINKPDFCTFNCGKI
jgi:MoaA/NifB/PqqE/SkfB family radical SAM enzyme